MYKGYVFDLDGTIVDSLENIGNLLNKKLRIKNIEPIPIDIYRILVGDGSRKLVQRSVELIKERDRLNWNEKEEEEFFNNLYDDFMYSYLNKYEGDSKEYDGIKESLDYLKKNNKLIVICTNKPLPAAYLILNNLFGENYFDYIVGVEDNIKTKPDPQMINMIMEKLELKKEEIVYFGDTSTDMITAKNAGIFAVGVTWGFRDKEELIKYGADKVINNPLDIMGI